MSHSLNDWDINVSVKFECDLPVALKIHFSPSWINKAYEIEIETYGAYCGNILFKLLRILQSDCTLINTWKAPLTL